MIILLSLVLAQTAAPPDSPQRVPADASRLTVGTPTTVTVVDIDRIKGEPWRLNWSPGGDQLHLVAMKRMRDNSLELTHHLIELKSGEVRRIDSEPEWASQYWTWKSDRAAPENRTFAIELDQQQRNESATARPMGGTLARGAPTGAPGAAIDDVAGQTSANVLVITLLLKGAVLGQWKNEPFVAGLTFGWAPPGMNAIAFAGQDGRLVLMDEQGRKQRVEATKDVRLPAWSTDGHKVAWAEKQGRKMFRIQVADVN